MEIKLQPHQQKIVDLNPHKYGIWHSTGTGKTITSISLANKNCKTCLVIVPKIIVKQWEREIEKYKNGCEFSVISKEQFKIHVDELPEYDGVVVDECFCKGTKVLTPSGYVNIEDIKVGDIVNNAIGYGKVTRIGNKNANKILIIKLSNGITLKVTEDHPFFTDKGWVKAKNLLQNNELLHYLFIYDNIIEYGRNKKMSNMWKRVQGFVQKHKNTCLWDVLWNEISTPITPRNSKRELEKNEIKKSYEQFINKEKNDKYFKDDGSQTKNSWWKWNGNASSSKNFIISFGKWMVCRACGENKENIKFSIQLQNRYSKSTKNDSNRSGWWKSFINSKTTTRQKERKCFKSIRVESIQVQERRSDEQFTVYNLEVSGHPSYVVADILVHNCQFFANRKSQLSKALRKYFKKYDTEYRWLCTATPVLSTPLNVYSLAEHLNYKWDYWAFFNDYFYRIPMGNRMVPKVKPNIDTKLAGLVASLGSVVDMKDIVDVPEQTDIVQYFNRTPEQEKAIQELTDTNFITRWTKSHTIENGLLYSDGYSIDQTFPCLKNDFIASICIKNKKVAIFCRYNKQIDLLRFILKPLKKILVLNGDTFNKDEVIKEANESDECIILIQSQVSAGYELPTIDTIIFASLSFSYIDEVQARGRFLRINNLKKNTYYYLITRGVDEDVYSCIKNKRDFYIELYDNK